MRTHKACSICKISKTLESFSIYKNKAGRDVIHSRCRPCDMEYFRRWKLEHPVGWKKRHIRDRYGIEMIDHQRMLRKQGWTCGICRKSFPSTRGRHIDHDHKTGKVRDVLCAGCNLRTSLVEKGRNKHFDPAPYIEYIQRHHPGRELPAMRPSVADQDRTASLRQMPFPLLES